ncbi:uncharacterized protein LOC111319226 [Stylophora pistillata]|uniref:uncharacterized protein LOC111319226 n=1 Tax=Stylophora pistillata TaxID=50429 RepID=UPI000C04E486|nr:uncharacterized protein LOC111319226 [Stylophora pistillata]
MNWVRHRQRFYIAMADIHCFVLIVLLVLCAFSSVSGNIGKCEKLKIPMCQGLGYNFTYVPNIFNLTQEEAALEVHQFWPLVEIKCSTDLKVFLCAMYAPACQPNVKTEVPPCRSLCERVRKGCARFLRQYGYSWPKRMKCKKFPQLDGKKPCIAGNRIVANGTHPVHVLPTKTSPVRKCERIKIPMCQSIGYNFTYMPNMFNHRTQKEAADEVRQFWPLVKVKCSPDLRVFLCSLYAPICQPNFNKEIPPCRSLCIRAKEGCEPLMRRYGFTWPKRMKCETFPKFGNKACIGRMALSTTASPLPPVALLPTKTLTATKKCEKIKIPFCQGIGYNYTSLPNIKEEDAVDLQQFRPLFGSKCSPDLKRFLCSMYAPECPPKVTDPLPPCRSTCKQARRGCAPFMRLYRVRWPKKMRCKNFPKAGGKKSCIDPKGNAHKGS